MNTSIILKIMTVNYSKANYKNNSELLKKFDEIVFTITENENTELTEIIEETKDH